MREWPCGWCTMRSIPDCFVPGCEPAGGDGAPRKPGTAHLLSDRPLQDWNKNFIELLRIILLLQSEGVSFSPWVVTDMRVSKYAHRFEQALRVTNLQTHVRVLPGVQRGRRHAILL